MVVDYVDEKPRFELYVARSYLPTYVPGSTTLKLSSWSPPNERGTLLKISK